MDGYDRDRDPYSNNDRGRIFENGTYEHYHLREKGYVQQSQVFRVPGIGNVVFDKIANDQGKILADEDKSGRLDSKKDEKQLAVVYELLRTGRIDHYTLRTVERELISERCQELIDKIRRDFPEKSTHLIIDRETAREIWAKGLAIERGQGQQLELDKVREKAREGKAQALQNARDKQAALAKAREAREKFRAMQAFRESAARGRADAPRHVQAERAQQAELRAERAKTLETRETERDRVTRDAAEKAVREFQGRLQSGPEPSSDKAPEKTTPGRESPEAAKAALIEQVARDAARLAAREFPFPVPDKPREQQAVDVGERSPPEAADAARTEREAAAEREAADKARETAAQREAEAREAARTRAELDQARDAAYREMLNQAQVPEHVRLGLSHAQAPQAAVQTPPGQAPSVERGGTGQGKDPRTPEIGPRSQ
ncbi:hypothetical protein [Nocardia suismassiliense]|uniref:hypothetical protein n=1 Tax=Nocardia suismassiliense TaxID=2077092 RepID=UPI00131F1082|nr:hypothetical protein [Nocardia suismassiliense]